MQLQQALFASPDVDENKNKYHERTESKYGRGIDDGLTNTKGRNSSDYTD